MFSEEIKCQNCNCIMISPIICLSCQFTFCKNCKEKMKDNCEKFKAPNITEAKKNHISKFKFKCIKGCDEEIKYQDIENHYNSDCLSRKKVKALTQSEAAKYSEKTGKEIPHITSS